MTEEVPTVPNAARNVVSNLRSSLGDKIATLADWQVDFAHRHWSTSDEFPNEESIPDWAPEDKPETRLQYAQLTRRER